MTKHRLWFIKDGATVRGPFPAAQLRQDVLLGRVKSDVLVSEDQQGWKFLHDLPALFDPEQTVDVARQRQLLDERRAERRQNQDPSSDSRRVNPDRRLPEDAATVQSRQTRTRVWNSLMGGPANALRILVVLLAVAVAIGIAGYFMPATLVTERLGVDCGAPPQAAGVWDGCSLPAAELGGTDLRGASFAYANLAESDLAYANLTDARLAGADLRRARLQFARLRDADLSHADLRDADLSGAELHGAVLGGAIWPDGTRCAKPSVGACLRTDDTAVE